MNGPRAQIVADAVFRRGEYVDALADDIARMRLTGEQAVEHLRRVATGLRGESDKVMGEVRS